MTFEDIRALASGFQRAKVLLSAVELGFFDALSHGPLSAAAIAGKTGCDPRAVEITANALVALGLLSKEGETFSNSEEAARWLVESGEHYRGSIIKHLGATWEDWAEYTETLKCGTAHCTRKEGNIPKDPESVRNFILGMENMTRELAPMLAELLPLDGCGSILDLGGGPGNYSLAFALRRPEARVVHFDLPATSKVAREFLAGRDGAERIDFVTGNFLTDPVGKPGQYDFIWISQVLHMLGDDEVLALLGKVADTLAPGGVIAVHEHFLDASMTAPASAALFSSHMLAVTKRGRAYGFDELEAMLGSVGVGGCKRIDYGKPPRVLVGRKL